mgnify:CR=1 FL=1
MTVLQAGTAAAVWHRLLVAVCHSVSWCVCGANSASDICMPMCGVYLQHSFLDSVHVVVGMAGCHLVDWLSCMAVRATQGTAYWYSVLQHDACAKQSLQPQR